jgi:hypothetical protein
MDPPSGTVMNKDEERLPIFDAYMTFLCGDLGGKPFNLDKEKDFIAGNKGENGRGDMQGCSKFNLQVVLATQGKLAPANFKDHKEANAPNRRVIAYMFKPGSKIDVADDKDFKKWPCPPPVTVPYTAKSQAAIAQCQKRFWSDTARGEGKKGADPKTPRSFRESENTFECRFYHGLALHSPCEDIIHLWIVRLTDRGSDGELVPLANRRCVAALGDEADAILVRTRSGDDGRVHLPVIDDRTIIRLKVDAFGANVLPPTTTESGGGDPEAEPGEDQYLELTLDAGALVAESDDLGRKQRLHNLGFGPSDLAVWTDNDFLSAKQQFCQSRKPPVDVNDSAAFDAALSAEYGDSETPPPSPENG